MRSLLGLVSIIFLCQCSQKHPVIPTEPLFLEAPPENQALFIAEEGGEKESPRKARKTDPAYRQIHRLWNDDKNDEALELAFQTSESASFKTKPDSVRLAHHQLAFQIAYDLQDLSAAQKAFDTLDSVIPCSEKKQSNTLSLALLYYASKNTSKAIELLRNETCDETLSLSQSLTKTYWLYRFLEGSSSNKKKYLHLLGSLSSVPHFYTVLASLWEEKAVGSLESFQSFTGEFPSKVRVNPEVRKKLMDAEFKMKKKDRVGSLETLFQLKNELLKNPRQYPESLFYISRLFQAQGEHLESMKIVNQLVEDNSDKLAQSEWVETFHRPFEEEVITLCDRWGVDPDLVYSLIRQESAFNPGAHSVAGARGLVQLMPVLSKFILEQWRVPVPANKQYLFQVRANLPIAIYHLHQLQQVFPHPALVAAAYNAGVSRVNQWTQRFGHFPLDLFTEFVPVRETRDYIKYVMRNLWVYKKIKKSKLYSKSHQSAGRGDELCRSSLEVLTGAPCIQ